MKFHLPGVPNVKFDGYCAETRNFLSTFGVFGMGVDVCPMDISPSATMERLCSAGKRFHKRGCRK